MMEGGRGKNFFVNFCSSALLLSLVDEGFWVGAESLN